MHVYAHDFNFVLKFPCACRSRVFMIPNQGGHRADEKELGEELRSLFWCGYPLVSGGRMRRKGLSGNEHDTISSWSMYVAEEENHAVYAVAQNACQPMNSMCVLICVNPFSVWPCVLFDTFLAGAATGEVFAIKTIKKSKVRAGTCSIWYAVWMFVISIVAIFTPAA